MEYKPKQGRRFFCYPANNQVEGPFVILELAGLLHANHINGETLTLIEGEEAWLPFKDRSEYHFALEMPQTAIDQLASEQAEAQVSSWSPRKLVMVASLIGTPGLLYVLYRLARAFLLYELHGIPGTGS
jgi:hypothetical protein